MNKSQLSQSLSQSSKKNTVRQLIINKQFQVIKKIARGAFSQVYDVLDLQSNQMCVMKVQININVTSNEVLALEEINAKDIKGVPHLLAKGKLDKNYYFLILQKQGISLLDYYQYMKSQLGQKIDWRTLENMFVQVISILENIHKQGWIHGDVKPNNILIETSNQSMFEPRDSSKDKVSLIDFGLSIYSDPQLMTKEQSQIKKSNQGNIHFASSTQLINKSSRHTFRDDLESLIYTMVYLYIGDLPWGLFSQKPPSEIVEQKLGTTIKQLCKDLPTQFCNAIKYVFNLNPDSKPDYQLLISIVRGQKLRSNSSCKNDKSTTKIAFDQTIPTNHELKTPTKSQVQEIRELPSKSRLVYSKKKNFTCALETSKASAKITQTIQVSTIEIGNEEQKFDCKYLINLPLLQKDEEIKEEDQFDPFDEGDDSFEELIEDHHFKVLFKDPKEMNLKQINTW